MSGNQYARPPACPRCHDVRKLTRSLRAHDVDLVPCDRCGLLNAEEYERFRRDAWTRNQTPPSICEIDLSASEFVAFKRMRDERPDASKLTVLTWIEGQRYDPANDPAFLTECEAGLNEWRRATGRETERKAA
jgi:hypothetical protein